ncbi:MAG: CDP-alcohol phosphatidyltransferase family protein [Holophaga sp.]|nr:CDP-alcohol phosphatidyltransferase family protein [Holophaga sp.]
MLITLPNLLTLLRIFAVPFFAIALWYGHALEACLIFMGAGLTDLLDGFIARRFNQGSELGAILDPAADKLLMTTAFILMALPNLQLVVKIPMWVAILAVSRDLTLSLVAFLAFDRLGLDRLRPSLLGKITTAVELSAISFALIVNVIGVRFWTHWLFPWVYYLVAILVLCSGTHYFFRATQPKGKEA